MEEDGRLGGETGTVVDGCGRGGELERCEGEVGGIVGLGINLMIVAVVQETWAS